MQAAIKGRQLTLDDHLKTYVVEKIERPAAKYFDDASVTLEVELSDLYGPKGGNDKQCDVLMGLPKGTVLRIEEVSDDLYKAIDTAADRLLRALDRYKGKKLIGSRYPKKYYIAKRLLSEKPPENKE